MEGQLSLHLAMGEQEPEAKDWLGQHIKDGVSNNLSIDTELADTLAKDPDNWVSEPENQGEETEGSKELPGISSAVGDSAAARDEEDVNDDGESTPGECVPSPLGNWVSKGSKEAGQDHDDIGKDGDGDVRSTEAGKEGQIEKKKWSGEGPVDVTCEKDLAVDVDSLLAVIDDVVLLADKVGEGRASASGHGIV